MTKLISVVTPLYNEEENVTDLCDRIAAVMRSLPYEYEHICIDNCSRDRTAAMLREAGCDQLQGFHLARPMPAAEIARRWLATLPPPTPTSPVTTSRWPTTTGGTASTAPGVAGCSPAWAPSRRCTGGRSCGTSSKPEDFLLVDSQPV